ncbi:MAG: glucose-6-phosphate dehydrogenase, partial [Actinomycetota bacterium]
MSTGGYTPGALSVGIDPHLFVIFGGTGDLARAKLLPALYQLLRRRNFQDRVRVLAVATRDIDEAEYRATALEALESAGHPEAVEWAEGHLHYQSLKHGFEALGRRIASLEHEAGLGGNRVFYLAVPPGVFRRTLESMGKEGLTAQRGWSRIVVEKPFGTDTESSMELNHLLHTWFAEEEVYRIDHYLAKETVQNLMALRFANPLFESSWNRDRIESVQITVAEDIGIGSRARYYDQAGALRDIMQNHALQIFSLVAMEPPVRATAQHIRDEKVKVLRATASLQAGDVVRGRYTGGEMNGSPVPGYLEEPGID